MNKDIFNWLDESQTIEVVANTVNSIRHKKIARKAARLFFDGKAVTQCGIGNISESELFKKCEANKDLALPSTFLPIRSENFTQEIKPLDILRIESNVQKMLTQLSKRLPDFVGQGKISYCSLHREFIQNDQYSKTYSHQKIEGYLCLKFKSSSNIIDYVTEIESGVDTDLNEMNNPHFPFLDMWKSEAKIDSGLKNICFLSDQSGILSKIYSALNPEIFHSGASLLSNKGNENLFHRDLQITDKNCELKSGFYTPFDDEGTTTQECPVIANEKFLGPFYDLRTAQKYQIQSTGHGKRMKIPHGSFAPTPHRLELGRSKKSMQDLWNESGETVVILMASGGDSNANGDFSTPVQVAFLIKDGKIIGRLPQLTLRGNIFDYLGKDFIATSSDSLSSRGKPALFTKMNIYLN